MTIRVRLFAVARQRVGSPTIEVDLPENSTVAELRRALLVVAPALSDVLSRIKIAVDSDYVEEGFELRPGADVALIPPVSGGVVSP